MKLFIGKLDTQYDPAFRLAYALTITSAAERSTEVGGEVTHTSHFHKAVMTVADNTGSVVGIFERKYSKRLDASTRFPKGKGALTRKLIKHIRRDLVSIVKGSNL